MIISNPACKKIMNSLSQQILNHARTLPEGEILLADSFSQLGKPTRIAPELSRLVKRRKLSRIADDMFVLSYLTRFGIRGPSVNSVVDGIARITGECIVTGGGTAANDLGLSKHVSIQNVFWTSGPDRIVKIGPRQKIRLHHVPDWQLYAPNTKTGDGIRAFACLGESGTDRVFDKFEYLLTEEERQQLLDMRPNLPAWMAGKLNTLAPVNSLSQKILNHARTLPEGEILLAESFSQLGKPTRIAPELSRLVERRKLSQIADGMFVLSYLTRFGIRGPSVNSVVDGIARITGERIVISGVAAACLLGLSKNTPLRNVFWTSGPDRAVKLGPRQKIRLHHVPDWQLYAPNTKTGDGIRAFVQLGKLETGRVFDRFESLLNEEERQQLLDMRPNLPAWMAAQLSTLASSGPVS